MNGSCQLLSKVCALSTGECLGGQSLPRNGVVGLTDYPDMTITTNNIKSSRLVQYLFDYKTGFPAF